MFLESSISNEVLEKSICSLTYETSPASFAFIAQLNKKKDGDYIVAPHYASVGGYVDFVPEFLLSETPFTDVVKNKTVVCPCGNWEFPIRYCEPNQNAAAIPIYYNDEFWVIVLVGDGIKKFNDDYFELVRSRMTTELALIKRLEVISEDVEALEAIMDSISDPVVILNDKLDRVKTNFAGRGASLFGVQSAEFLGCDSTSENPDDCPISAVISNVSPRTDYYEVDSKYGVKYIKILTSPLMYKNELMVMRMLTDLSDLHSAKTRIAEKEAHLNYVSNHDTLTGLPNRQLLQDVLSRSILSAERVSSKVAFMTVSLSRFKKINESMGHEIGDKILKIVAQRLQSCIRKNDQVARIGGDVFGIVMEFKKHSSVDSVAQKVIETISSPIKLEEQDFFLNSSVGIAIYPDDGLSEDTLFKNSDVAMYRMKESGGNDYRYYQSEMTEKAKERMQLESDLRKAIDMNEIVVFYQPKVDLSSKKVVGLEALVRWQHSTKGLVSPLDFIPLAEETGLIIPIGRFVLHSACEFAARLKRKGFGNIHVAVNFSSRQFRHENVVKLIDEALNSSQLDSNLLEVELTESIVMEDVEETIELLNEISNHGVSIAVDDFGTGYSSLSYLKKFPITTLKIDRSFIKDIPENTEDASISKAIISLADSLGMHVVAEGVEINEQVDFLIENKCKYAQGFLYSKPIREDELIKFLSEFNA